MGILKTILVGILLLGSSFVFADEKADFVHALVKQEIEFTNSASHMNFKIAERLEKCVSDDIPDRINFTLIAEGLKDKKTWTDLDENERIFIVHLRNATHKTAERCFQEWWEDPMTNHMDFDDTEQL